MTKYLNDIKNIIHKIIQQENTINDTGYVTVTVYSVTIKSY